MESGISQREICPLEINLILAHTFSHLPVLVLKEARLVSKRWNQLAINTFKKRRCNILNFQSSGRKGYKKLDDFTSLMRSSMENLFWAYEFQNCSFKNESVQNFFKTCGFTVKSLNLELDISKNKFMQQDDLQPEFNNLLKLYATNLEDLDIEVLPNSITNPDNKVFISSSDKIKSIKLKKITFPVTDEDYCPIYWGRIFIAAKNLQEVFTNHKVQTSSILKALITSNRLRQLSTLRLEYLNQEALDSLLSCNLVSIKEFKFNTISKTVQPQKLERLLKNMSGNLRVLALGSPSDNTKMIIQLPRMPHLKRLGLFHIDYSIIYLHSLLFSKDLPSLNVLELSSALKRVNWKEYLSFAANKEEQPCETVNELAIGIVVLDEPEYFVSYLNKLFPSVKKLSLECPNSRLLKAIWRHWKNLEELNVFFINYQDESQDELFFGIQENWKQTIMKSAQKFNKNWWKRIENPQVKSDSICNFQNLMRLTIEYPPNDDTKLFNHLTDFSGYFGFKKLKNLRVLKIGRSQISHTCKEYLLNELPMISELNIKGMKGPGILRNEELQEFQEYLQYYKEHGDPVDEANYDSDSSDE